MLGLFYGDFDEILRVILGLVWGSFRVFGGLFWGYIGGYFSVLYVFCFCGEEYFGARLGLFWVISGLFWGHLEGFCGLF